MSAKKYVCNQAKIECQMCTNPQGTLMVTSNMIKLQGKLWATEKDKEKTNLIFQGTCKASPQQSVPCIAVIQTGNWQGTGDVLVQNNKALLESSTIMCNYGGSMIKIKDDLQKSQPSSLIPTAVDGITPDEPVSKLLVSSSLEQVSETVELQEIAEVVTASQDSDDNQEETNKDSTYFLFLDEKSKKPIAGLTFSIATSDDKSIQCATNEKGYFEISSDQKAPFKLRGHYYGKITKSDDKLSDLGKDVYTLEKSEEKPVSHIDSLKDKSTDNKQKLLVGTTKVKVKTGDTLEKYFKQHLPSLDTKSNKGSVLMDFNFGSPVKGTYRAFDFGKSGEIFIPKFDAEVKSLKEKTTHVFHLSKVERKPFGQKMLKDTHIVKRNTWTNQSLSAYDILDPSKVSPKKTPLEFDWNYHTIVLHHSGDGLDTHVNAIENLHITKNNWEDVGYHFVIGRAEHNESKIYEARPLPFKGSHASGKNSKKIGIMVEGDFDHQWWDIDDEVEPNQVVLLRKLISSLLNYFPIVKLIGHSDVSGKEIGDGCPGEKLYDYIPGLRKKFNLK